MIRIRPCLLALYRMSVLILVAIVLRVHHRQLQAQGEQPLSVAEVHAWLPSATRLRADSGSRAGFHVLDAAGDKLGYAVCTAPTANRIIGYAGPADTLVVFDAHDQVIGTALRSSLDTPGHIEDVRRDDVFLASWNGQSWGEIARMNLQAAGIEGVSGATRTSMCMAEGIVFRLAAADQASTRLAAPIRFGRADLILFLALIGGLTLVFWHGPKKRNLRRGFQVFTVLCLGLFTGDLLAQSLFIGWITGAVPWRTAPGVVLLAAAALVIPWLSRRPMYCAHICPHGVAQEWIGRVRPRSWRLKLPRWLDWGLKRLPATLLIVIVLATALATPLDLARLEAFDAWLLGAAVLASTIIAIFGLLATAVIPMAYCRYGCPTGALFKFIRSHGKADRFGAADALAGCLLVVSILLTRNASTVQRVLLESNWI